MILMNVSNETIATIQAPLHSHYISSHPLSYGRSLLNISSPFLMGLTLKRNGIAESSRSSYTSSSLSIAMVARRWRTVGSATPGLTLTFDGTSDGATDDLLRVYSRVPPGAGGDPGQYSGRLRLPQSPAPVACASPSPGTTRERCPHHRHTSSWPSMRSCRSSESPGASGPPNPTRRRKNGAGAQGPVNSGPAAPAIRRSQRTRSAAGKVR